MRLNSYYFIKTAIVNVTNDFHVAKISDQLSVIITLDMSAVFDTVICFLFFDRLLFFCLPGYHIVLVFFLLTKWLLPFCIFWLVALLHNFLLCECSRFEF